ncbi:MAG: hypothetical protein H6707_06265 [Deltaproteobacteria bacterium]|nr:hypothetical protein [Deltaproteobacteria bacterium]
MKPVLLPLMTPLRLGIGLAVLSIALMIWLTAAALRSANQLPDPGPAPERQLTGSLAAKHAAADFRDAVTERARQAGMPGFPLEELAAATHFRREFSGRQLLKGGKKLTTHSLQLSAHRRKIWVGLEGQRVRLMHILLIVKNRTNRPLAYRIITRASRSCDKRAILRHNMFALGPREQLVRAECTGSGPFVVQRIETLSLSRLGYHFVSRLSPDAFGLSSALNDAHITGKLPPCRLLPQRLLARTLAQDANGWRDIIDFYARHDCDRYNFYAGYHWRAGRRELPALGPTTR